MLFFSPFNVTNQCGQQMFLGPLWWKTRPSPLNMTEHRQLGDFRAMAVHLAAQQNGRRKRIASKSWLAAPSGRSP